MKKFIVGTILGGLLLSGGWFAWAAIQSQVGLNVVEHDTSGWVPMRGYDVGDVTSGAYVLPGGAAPNITPVFVVKPDINNNNWSVDVPASASSTDADGAQLQPTANYLLRLTTPTYRIQYQASLADNQATLAGGFGISAVSNLIFNDSTWQVPFGQAINADGVTARTTADIPSSAAYPYGWNGTTYDRVKALANNADDVAVTTTGSLATNSYKYEFDGTTYDRVRHSFSQSTASITGNAAGTTVTMSTTPMSKFTMVIDRTVGSTNPVEVDLQCSLDGSIWVQIGTITDLTNEPVLTSVDGNPCQSMRYNVVTVGSGNTLTIQLLATR